VRLSGFLCDFAEPGPRACNHTGMSPVILRTAVSLLLLAAGLAAMSQAHADTMPMRDFHLLDIGMSQAEVLYRVGPPDHETVFGGSIHGITRVIWYYIPQNPNGWITEIIFDSHGRIKNTKRYKP